VEERITNELVSLRRYQAREGVGAAAGRQWDDDAYLRHITR
jgi:hypothetical protein